MPVPDFIQPPILRRLLHFIYADDTLEPSSAEEAQHLLAAGDHYGLTRLVALCAAFLSAQFTVDNVALTLTLADQRGLEDLKARALRFVSEHAVAVVATPGWAHCKAARLGLMDAVILTLAKGGVPAAGSKRPRES